MSRARFILVVEKDSVLQKLVDEQFVVKFAPCILATVCAFIIIISFLPTILGERISGHLYTTNVEDIM
jgi:hypothetical protein